MKDEAEAARQARAVEQRARRASRASTSSPVPVEAEPPRPPGGEELAPAAARSVRLQLPEKLHAKAAETAEEEEEAADFDNPISKATAALRCELHGLRVALRILGLLR